MNILNKFKMLRFGVKSIYTERQLLATKELYKIGKERLMKSENDNYFFIPKFWTLEGIDLITLYNNNLIAKSYLKQLGKADHINVDIYYEYEGEYPIIQFSKQRQLLLKK